MQPRINLYTNALAGRIVGNLVAANKTAEPHLPVLTRELVKVRSSQLNGCSYCLDMHTKDAAHAGETPQRVNLVAAWRETTLFSEAERAALELAEQGTRIAFGHGVTAEAWNAAAQHYDEDQLVALVSEIAVINAFNRVCVMTQQPGGHYQPAGASQPDAEAVAAS